MRNDFRATLEWIRQKTQNVPEYVGAWVEKIRQNQHKSSAASAVDEYFLRHTFVPLVGLRGWVQRAVDIWGRQRRVAAFAEQQSDAQELLSAAMFAALANGHSAVLLASDEAHRERLRSAVEACGLSDVLADCFDASAYHTWQQQHRPPQRPAQALPPTLVRLLQSAAQQMRQLDQWAALATQPLGCAQDYAHARRQAHNAASQLQQLNLIPTFIDCAALLKLPAEQQQQQFAAIGDIQRTVQQLPHEQKQRFDQLHPRFSQLPNTRQLQSDTAASLLRMHQAIDAALRDTLAQLYLYQKDLEAHYTLFFQERQEQLDALRDAAQAAEKIHPLLQPQEADKSRSFMRQQEQWNALQQILLPTLQALHHAERTHGYTPHVFAQYQRQGFTLKALLQDLDLYEQRLIEWYSQRMEQALDEVQDLRSDQLQSEFSSTPALAQTLRGLQMLAQNINRANIFRQPLLLDNPLIKTQIQRLQALQNYIQALQTDWEDFPRWHAFAYWSATLPKGIDQLVEQVLPMPHSHTQFAYNYWRQLQAQYELHPHWLNPARTQQIIEHLQKDEADYAPILRDFVRQLWQTQPQKYPLLLLSPQTCALHCQTTSSHTGEYNALISYGDASAEFALALAAAQQSFANHCGVFSQPNALADDFGAACWQLLHRLSPEDQPACMSQSHPAQWLPFRLPADGGTLYRWLDPQRSYYHWQEYNRW